MPTAPQRLWDGVLRRLGAELTPPVLDVWIGPLVPAFDGERLRLACPTVFHRDRVRDRQLAAIERCAAEEAGRPVEVDLCVSETSAPRSCDERTKAGPACAERARPAASSAPDPAPPPRREPPVQRELPYRFDNFVVGPCNALAREAALAVARGSQHSLNPLVITTAAADGKSHLARAIVAEARSQGETAAIYTSAENFTSQFTSALRARRIDDFKRRYRRGCRLLVIEDLQFFDARKKATQLELFHTVSHLLDVGARVVFTADSLPGDLEGLHPGLRSKLRSGLIAELEPPDAAVRREILRRKAADGGVRLPDACRERIVEAVRGSVRDLEGVLIQLVATSLLLKKPVDLTLTEAALRKLAPAGRPRRLGIGEVLEVVAAHFRMRPDELSLRSRRRADVSARQLAMYLCRRYTDAGLSEIGDALGRKHSSVSNAIRQVERGLLERAPLRYQVEALCARLDERIAEGR